MGTSTGYRSTGHRSTGNWSTGHRSTGNWSTGNMSTGNWSTGYRSTGHRSTGNWSTGNRSTGNWSTGNMSTGNWSTGNRSTGNWSTGNWSTGNWSTGWLSTDDYSPLGLFDVPMTIEEINAVDFPEWFYWERLTEWVESSNMTDAEKAANPQHATTGGFLRVSTYHECWRRSWDAASDEDRRKTLTIPHWDNAKFLAISGIDVEAELAVDAVRQPDEVFVNGVRYVPAEN